MKTVIELPFDQRRAASARRSSHGVGRAQAVRCAATLLLSQERPRADRDER